MKKTMLWVALFSIISSQATAEPSTAITVAQDTPAAAAPAVIKPLPIAQPTQEAPLSATPATATSAAPAVTTPAVTAPPTATPPVPTVNCDYKIPADTKKIDKFLVSTWSERAVVQSFDMVHSSVDMQLDKLQSCFTKQGWEGYNSALQKSGNIQAIKEQHLTVSSQVDGQVDVVEGKDDQWTVAMPLHVVYQNDKEKVTQLLDVKLTVGRKTNGDLGIMQIIASPRVNVMEQKPATPAVMPAAEQH